LLNGSRISIRTLGVALAVGVMGTVLSASRATDEETALLKKAQAIFEPLPPDMGTTEFPVMPELRGFPDLAAFRVRARTLSAD
jgi:hypothetical protein